MDCTALTEVTVNRTTAETIPVIVPGEFTNLTAANIKLIVPTGTEALYQAATGWQDLAIEEENLSTDAIARELGFNVVSNVVENSNLKKQQLLFKYKWKCFVNNNCK